MDSATMFFAMQCQLPAFRHGLNGIHNQVSEYTAQVGSIGPHPAHRLELRDHRKIVDPTPQGPGKFQRVLHELAYVYQRGLARAAADVLAHPFDDFRSPAGGVINHAEVEALLVALLRT